MIHEQRYMNDVHTMQCLQCQLKKLVRVKSKQAMIITDTLGSSYDKIIMNIEDLYLKPEEATNIF